MTSEPSASKTTSGGVNLDFKFTLPHSSEPAVHLEFTGEDYAQLLAVMESLGDLERLADAVFDAAEILSGIKNPNREQLTQIILESPEPIKDLVVKFNLTSNNGTKAEVSLKVNSPNFMEMVKALKWVGEGENLEAIKNSAL